MLAIGGIGTSAAATRVSRRGTAASNDDQRTPGRALIAVEASAPSERICVPNRRPLAAFLAQLIATQTHAPQTRTRRRAEPDEATAVYGVRRTRSACSHTFVREV